jgi:hypothetical protein
MRSFASAIDEPMRFQIGDELPNLTGHTDTITEVKTSNQRARDNKVLPGNLYRGKPPANLALAMLIQHPARSSAIARRCQLSAINSIKERGRINPQVAITCSSPSMRRGCRGALRPLGRGRSLYVLNHLSAEAPAKAGSLVVNGLVVRASYSTTSSSC